jgi:2-C-methyl-D-erythritol 2,4-cyclodiphosphate synthase
LTDEAMAVERAGHPVRIVDGDERNVKITTPDDLAAARARLAGVPRVGTGYDLHRLVEGRPLLLAGVRVPFERGPFGHSDGDVVCHALIDAMLGAAAAGDIGQHFPNNDPRWAGAPGLDLLARAVAIIGDRGLVVSSADVTVILERPKLAPHLAAIRAALAGVLGIDADRIGLKGKTNEGVDATGRGEAIAAHAVAVLVPGGRA